MNDEVTFKVVAIGIARLVASWAAGSIVGGVIGAVLLASGLPLKPACLVAGVASMATLFAVGQRLLR